MATCSRTGISVVFFFSPQRERVEHSTAVKSVHLLCETPLLKNRRVEAFVLQRIRMPFGEKWRRTSLHRPHAHGEVWRRQNHDIFSTRLCRTEGRVNGLTRQDRNRLPFFQNARPEMKMQEVAPQYAAKETLN